MPRGGWRPGAGRKPNPRPELDGNAALKLVPPAPAPRARPSIREAIAKLQVVPSPAPPAGAPSGVVPGGASLSQPAATAPAPEQQTWQGPGVRWLVGVASQVADEHIRRATGEEPGEDDEDLYAVFEASAEEVAKRHLGEVAIPPELVCLVTGWILFSSRMEAARRRARARAAAPAPLPAAAAAASSPPPPSVELRPIVGTAPPRQAPTPPPPTDLPPDVPKGWGSYAQRFPPARKATTLTGDP